MVSIIEQTGSEYVVGSSPSGRRRWMVEGTADEAVAAKAIVDNTPATMSFLIRQRIRLSEFRPDPDPARFLWMADVEYGATPIPTIGEIKYQSSSRGGRERITQALSTPHRVALAGRTAPDTQGAIGVDGRGNIAGVEIVVPKSTFSFETSIEADRYTDTYAAGLDELTGTTNDRPFFGRPTDTVLFLGHETDGTIATDGEVQSIRVKFFFGFSRADTVTIGNLPPLTVPGWHYIDVTYEDTVDENFKISRPVYAQAHRIYTATDFRGFGLNRI